jgi:hypothetical protein
MTSDPKPNARPFYIVRLPFLGAPRFASRSVGVFLDNDFPLADTATLTPTSVLCSSSMAILQVRSCEQVFR